MDQLLDSPRSATGHRLQNDATGTAALKRTPPRQPRGNRKKVYFWFAHGLHMGSTVSEYVYSECELHLEKFAYEVDTEEKNLLDSEKSSLCVENSLHIL